MIFGHNANYLYLFSVCCCQFGPLGVDCEVSVSGFDVDLFIIGGDHFRCEYHEE